MKNNIHKLVHKYALHGYNGETRCTNSGTFCQGIKDLTG